MTTSTINKKIKIAFCTDGIFPHSVGGIQRHSRLLIQELSNYKDIELVVYHPHNIKIFSAKNIKEVTIEGIRQNKVYLLECYRYSKRIFNELINENFDVIYSQGLSIWYSAKKIKNKLIINPHGLEAYQGLTFEDKFIGLPFRSIFNYLFNKSKITISLGGKLTGILERSIKNKKSEVIEIPNAVMCNKISDTNNIIKENSDVLKVLFVGRFAHNKGIHILIQAVEKLNDLGWFGKIYYNLVGKGPLYEEYKTKYRYANVNFLGFVDDDELDNIYNESDILALPTLFEGMPTVVLEAMERAKPIIVTDVGATSVLVDKSNGYLIEKNNLQQFMDAITDFYGLSIEKRAKLGENSLRKVNENFTWKKVAKSHYELFLSIASEL